MGFTEITPNRAVGDPGTGVKVSLTDRGGLGVSLSGEALAALGGAAVPAVRVLLDLDPAFPRLRLVADPVGRFKLGRTALGKDRVRIVRIGHRPEFSETRFRGMACVWETTVVQGGVAVDIELPREMRPVTTVSRPGSVPSTSTGNGRQVAVTLAGKRGSS